MRSPFAHSVLNSAGVAGTIPGTERIAIQGHAVRLAGPVRTVAKPPWINRASARVVRMDDKQRIRQIRKAIKRLMVLGDTYFRFLRWCVECHTAPDPEQVCPFALGRKEILALGFDTVQSFRGRWEEEEEYNPSDWEEVKCVVVWDKHEFTPARKDDDDRRRVKSYRDDLAFLADWQSGRERAPIPASAKVSRIEFTSPPEAVPFHLVYDRIEDLTSYVERILPRNIVFSPKWPGRPEFQELRGYEDVSRSLSTSHQRSDGLLSALETRSHEYRKHLVWVLRRLQDDLALPRQPAAQVVEVEAEATAGQGTASNRSRCSITRSKACWRFRFLDEEAVLPGHLRGLRVLAFLLRRPDKEFFPKQLLIEVDLLDASEASFSGEKVTDVPIAEINSTIEELKARREESSDFTEREKYEEDISKLERYRETNYDIHGRPRAKMEDKHRRRVCKLLDRIFEKIQEQAPQLHKHFDRHITLGHIISYKPDGPTTWHIT